MPLPEGSQIDQQAPCPGYMRLRQCCWLQAGALQFPLATVRCIRRNASQQPMNCAPLHGRRRLTAPEHRPSTPAGFPAPWPTPSWRQSRLGRVAHCANEIQPAQDPTGPHADLTDRLPCRAIALPRPSCHVGRTKPPFHTWPLHSFRQPSAM